jgi:hypothetical protein
MFSVFLWFYGGPPLALAAEMHMGPENSQWHY